MQALRHFRGKAKGLADLLNYAALVDEGVVLCKDGSLLAGYFYRGDDIQSMTDGRLNEISFKANHALMHFGSGWSTWSDAVCLEAAAYSDPSSSHFQDPISKLIDAERRQHFTREGQHFESEHAMYVMYTPPFSHESKVIDVIYDDDGEKELPGDRALKTFKRVLEEFEDAMSDVVRLSRMRSYTHRDGRAEHMRDELVNALHGTLAGEYRPINVPKVAMYMDAYLGGQELWPGDTPKLGDKFISCVAIEGFPGESYPGILDRLNHLAIPYRFSTRMLYLDKEEALPILARGRRKWKQKERGFFSQLFRIESGQVNADAVMMAQEAAGAETDAHSGAVKFGYYTAVIVLMSESRAVLHENARLVKRVITDCGFAARVETVNTLEAWLGSLPGHTAPNVRRPLLHTLALADLLPLNSVWSGRPENPCPFYPKPAPALLQGSTTGATPFRLNLHVGDVGHTLIFGPTGAGKSTLLGAIAMSHLRYQNATICGFDKGNSMLALCLATGGQAYEPGGDSGKVGFCPLQHLETDADAAWAEEWIATLFALQMDRGPDPEEKAAIHRAITNMRSMAGFRSLSDFLSSVQNKTVRGAVEHYAVDGPLGELLDAKEDSLADATFTLFEIDQLMGMGNNNALPVLLYLFRRFERRLTGQPALLILDEAWMMLGHPVFREKIREWLRTLRRANCAVVMATQSVSDAVNSGALDSLIENCPTKIFLPNPNATQGTGGRDGMGPVKYYEDLGLNETERQLLTHAQRKRDYYYTSPEGQRLFSLELGPIALAFLGASDKESLSRVKALHQTHGEAWPWAWLAERRVSYQQFLEEVDHARAA